MRYFNKIIVYIIITILVVGTSLQFAFQKAFATDATGTFIFDPESASIFNDSFNSTYNEYMSPELWVFGIDQMYNDINSALYDKYGWDIETIPWEQLNTDPTTLHYSALNYRIIGTDWEDTLHENAYVWLKGALPIAKQGVQDAWGYIVGHIDSVTGKITNLWDNLVLPFTPSLRDHIIDTIEETLEENDVINLSDTKCFLYGTNFVLQQQFGSQWIKVNYSFDKPVYIFIPSDEPNNIYPFYSTYDTVTLTAVKTTNGDHSTTVLNFTGDTWLKHCTSQVIVLNYWCKLLNDFNTTMTRSEFLNWIDAHADAHTGTFTYRWGASQALQSALDRLLGQYVTTKDLTDIIDVLDDSYVAPIPQEQDGVITDSLPLLIPEDDVIDDIDDIIDDIIAWNEEIEDIVEDVPVDDVIDDPIPVPEPDPIIPDSPIELPEWIVPSVIPDIFDFKGLDIFKPIFDIVGLNYSMYNTWILIPTICILVLILYIIISVL